MDVVPWLEKTWREHQRTHKIKWKKPERQRQIEGQEHAAGREVFRQAWLDYLDTDDKPNLFAFLRAWPFEQRSQREQIAGKSGGNGVKHQGPQPTGKIGEGWAEKLRADIKAGKISWASKLTAEQIG
jgi:hypothetical protein